MKNHNYLTLLKITVCCLFFFCVPVLTDALTVISESRTVALTLSISTAAMFLIFANHQLAALHYRRFIANIKENTVYVIFAALFVLGVYLLGKSFFSFQSETIDLLVLKKYPFFAPLILITYSFSFSFCFNIVFKLLTDQIHFSLEPHITILMSGLLFGLFLSLSQFALLPLIKGMFDTALFFKGFCINVLISLCTSYCYNQTSTIVPMTFGLTIASIIILFI